MLTVSPVASKIPTLSLFDEEICEILIEVGFIREIEADRNGGDGHVMAGWFDAIKEKRVLDQFWKGVEDYQEKAASRILKEKFAGKIDELGVLLGRDRAAVVRDMPLRALSLCSMLFGDEANWSNDAALNAGYVRVASFLEEKLRAAEVATPSAFNMEKCLCLGTLFTCDAFGDWLDASNDERESERLEEIAAEIRDRVHRRSDFGEDVTVNTLVDLQDVICEWGMPLLVTLWVLRNSLFDRLEAALCSAQADRDMRTAPESPSPRAKSEKKSQKSHKEHNEAWETVRKMSRLWQQVQAIAGRGDNDCLSELGDHESTPSQLLDEIIAITNEDLPLVTLQRFGLHGPRWSSVWTHAECERATRELVLQKLIQGEWIPDTVVGIKDPAFPGGIEVRDRILAVLRTPDLRGRVRKALGVLHPSLDQVRAGSVTIEGGRDNETSVRTWTNIDVASDARRVLLVDDTSLSGRTLQIAQDALRKWFLDKYGRDVEVRCAVLAAGRRFARKSRSMGINLTYHCRQKQVLGKSVEFPWSLNRVPASGPVRDAIYEPERLHRPWGVVSIFTPVERAWVRTLTIEPGHALSFQKHSERDEVFCVMQGQVRVHLGTTFLDGEEINVPYDYTIHRQVNGSADEIIAVQEELAKPGDQIFIAREVWHRFEVMPDCGAQTLECAFSDRPYSQADIQRLDDAYHRAAEGDAPSDQWIDEWESLNFASKRRKTATRCRKNTDAGRDG